MILLAYKVFRIYLNHGKTKYQTSFEFKTTSKIMQNIKNTSSLVSIDLKDMIEIIRDPLLL